MQQVINYMAESGEMVIGRIICLGILVSLSVMDIRYRAVPGSVLALGSVLAAGYCILFCRDHIWLNLGGLLIGLFFVLISKITREGIGYGDSLLICVLGVYLGTWNLLELLMIAWVGTAVAAMVVIARSKCRRGAALPMIPFITTGYVMVWVSEVLL